MVIFEALNALHGDCLLLRFGDGTSPDCLWLIDGGPKAAIAKDVDVVVWKDVLLPRLREIYGRIPIPIDLAIVSHIDDDHIFGLDKLANQTAEAKPNLSDVFFHKFWFNSFERLVGDECAQASLAAFGGARQVATISKADGATAENKANAVLSSVSQGNSLAGALKSLQLDGNFPFTGPVCTRPGTEPRKIDGAEVTVLGPSDKRLERLRKLWNSAKVAETDRARQAALQELFAPQGNLDRSVPNQSSIVLLIEIGEKRLLLSGDARGDHIVDDWKELNLADHKRKLEVLKVPHHGSWANNPRVLFEFFEAKHYVFSGDGGHGNPHPKVIEGLIELHCKREITIHFTNENVVWDKPYTLKRGGGTADNLVELLKNLSILYEGPWKSNFRKQEEFSLLIEV